jgi:predicted nucleic acid-binding protein
LQAAHIKAHHPISFADAFAAAAAQAHGATLLTGDPEFHAVEEFIKVDWLV